MKLTVLYGEDGGIVSLSRATGEDDPTADPIARRMRSGVRPGPGQRVALIEVDPAWHHRSLNEIHKSFRVEHDAAGPRFKEHAAHDHATRDHRNDKAQ